MTSQQYLIDVNLLIAIIFENHSHHEAAVEWFRLPGLLWSICPWTEAGFLRYATGQVRIGMPEATGILDDLAILPGYHYQPVTRRWRTLTVPFFNRLYGPKQVTDACLLGLAIQDNLILATFDKAILHMAGEHRQHVHVLESAGG